MTIYGDIYYEYAKFAQFYIGYYDSIMSDNFIMNKNGNKFEFKIIKSDYQRQVIKQLKRHNLYKKHLSKLDKNLVKYLYLSMISKHPEDKKGNYVF